MLCNASDLFTVNCQRLQGFTIDLRIATRRDNLATSEAKGRFLLIYYISLSTLFLGGVVMRLKDPMAEAHKHDGSNPTNHTD